jgi:hypothetical protein
MIVPRADGTLAASFRELDESRSQLPSGAGYIECSADRDPERASSYA